MRSWVLSEPMTSSCSTPKQTACEQTWECSTWSQLDHFPINSPLRLCVSFLNGLGVMDLFGNLITDEVVATSIMFI